MINWTIGFNKLGRKFLNKRFSSEVLLFVFTRNMKKTAFFETELIQFLAEIKSTTGIKRLISIKTSVAILFNLLKEKQIFDRK